MFALIVEINTMRMLTAEKGWRRIHRFKRLPDVIDGVCFHDGIAVVTELEKTEESQQRVA